MGGSNTKALWLCEQIFPNSNGASSIPPEKLQKLIASGKIPQSAMNAGGDVDLDDDLDSRIDACIKEVWAYYDPKMVGSINKSKAITFFKDALDLFALRRQAKTSDLLKPGVSMSKALEESFRQMDTSGTGVITFSQFEEFINTYDLEEALALITGQGVSPDISTSSAQMADYSGLAAASGEGQKAQIQYRDYGNLED